MDAHPAVPLTFDAVTTYGPGHWESHAKRCVETFAKHWKDIPLRHYTDDQLVELSPWLGQFKVRHRDLPTHNYRFDAVRFSHKVAAIEQAYFAGSADVLVWIDADCVTHQDVDAEWLSGMLGTASFGYLRREKKYPECGFMLIRRDAAGRDFILELVDQYRFDYLFNMQEWHDSWVIDQVRRASHIPSVSLSGDAEHTSHPLVNGPLGARLDHLKGKRKAEGRSRKSDLIRPRTEAHWNG